MADPQLQLLRHVKDAEVPTLGRLYVPGLDAMATLENPWRNNQPFVSCIPAGWYYVRLGTFKGQYDDLEVLPPPPGRSGIEIHAGNTEEETEGCILVASEQIWTAKGPALKADSRITLAKLVAWVRERGGIATLVVAYR